MLIVTGHRRGDATHLFPLPPLLLERHDQPGVEKREKDQRTAQHDDEVEDVVVDDAKNAVLSDVGEEVHRRDELSGSVGRRAVYVNAAVLEEPRYVVEDGGGGDVADVMSTARQRAQRGRVVRLADGRVAVERHEDGEQDGGS